MSNSSTSAAATSSCVDRGFDAQRTTSAPPALSVRARFAVSVVTCRHAEMRCPARGCSLSKRSRIAASTGICRSAHWIRRRPSGASARSFTSCRLVVAINPLSVRWSGGVAGLEEPLVLALLPFDPRRRQGFVLCDVRAGEPGLHGRAERGLLPKPERERELAELDAEVPPQLCERIQLVELADAVAAVPGRGAARDDEALLLQIAEHARRPTGTAARLADRHLVHARNLITTM